MLIHARHLPSKVINVFSILLDIVMYSVKYLQVSDTGRVLTVFYLVLLLPILLLYRSWSQEKQSDRAAADEEETKSLM